MADPSTNAKTSLVEFCQRYCGKSMGKTDIVYTTQEYDGQFQATVKLECVENQEFAGELATSLKAAEQAAASQALEGLKSEVAKMMANNKRKGAGQVVPPAKKLKGAGGEATSDGVPELKIKNKLREACKQILARDIADGDMVYETTDSAGGHTATLTLPNLPGNLGQRSWQGSTSPYKRDTMLVAAKAALDTILADPVYGANIDLSKVLEEPKEAKKKTAGNTGGGNKSSSKGKGKGMADMWNMDPWDMMWWMMTAMGKGSGKGAGWGKGWEGGKGKGNKPNKPSGPNLPRERIMPNAITGEVAEWKGKMGWITPYEVISHPSMKGPQSKIYLHINDMVAGVAPTKGATVQFHVYKDSSGIGAEEVVAF